VLYFIVDAVILMLMVQKLSNSWRFMANAFAVVAKICKKNCESYDDHKNLHSGVTIGRARRAVHAGPALWGPRICPTLFFLKLCWLSI